MNPVVKVLCGLLAVGAARHAWADAVKVPEWSVHEIALSAAREYGNPYTDVEVSATFTGPDGAMIRVRGFWDGGRGFKIRFTPTVPGEWRFAITSIPKGDGLTRSGSFLATQPRPGSHGFLRQDAQYPWTFSFDDETRLFMLGTTYYGIVGNARAGGGWQESVTNVARYGMNKVRMFLPFSRGGGDDRRGSEEGDRTFHYAQSSAFSDQTAERLDLEHWRVVDKIVPFMAEQGVLADLIVFPYRQEGEFAGTLEHDRRYLRYVLARYAAFPNVIWCLVNEWNYSVLSQGYWNEMGWMARTEDPWGTDRGQPRALSIHQQTRPDWNFADQTWPSHAVVQFGVRNRGKLERVGDEWVQPADGVKLFRHGDQWGNYSIVRNWTGKYPVVNDESGYIGEPYDDSAGGSKADDRVVRFTREKHRHTLWGIALAGGFAAAGDKNDYADGRPYMSANWHDVSEYGDIKRLVDLFTAPGFEYWKMAPHNEVIKSGVRVYVLAEPGRSYVFYAAAGGEFSAELAPGDYAAFQFDPRTGEEVAIARIHGGGASQFQCPDGQDWVFRLRRC